MGIIKIFLVFWPMYSNISCTPKASSTRTKGIKIPKFRIKTEITVANTSRKQPLLPSIKTHSTYSTIEQTKHLGIPLMNDDFRERKSVHSETFVLNKRKVIKCDVAFTIKFCYFTLHDMKTDSHYKLRLLEQTGRAIIERLKVYKLQLHNHIYQDQMKRYYLSAPFPPFERKFEFIKIEPSQTVELNCEEDDLYLKNAIRQLDRTEFIYGPLNAHSSRQ